MKDKIPSINMLRYFGILAIVVFWLFVAISIAVNPWFSFFSNALSDLGAPEEANNAWIYNDGLFLTSLLMFIFSLHLIMTSDNKLKTVGGAYISISAVFIALIGVFYGGTRPHSFVSTYFFIQFFFGMLIYGFGSGDRAVKYTSWGIFAVAFAGLLVPWPSVALVETYEILLIAIFCIVIALRGNMSMEKSERAPSS